MTDVAIELDEHNRDVLYCRRGEPFFTPNEDGSPSLNGKIIWHTEWWHYAGSRLRGTGMGPRIERQVQDIIDEVYDVDGVEITARQLIGALKAAFAKHAREDLGLTESENPDPE